MIKTSSKTPKNEVITGPERRRRWAPGEKSSMVYETYEPGMTVWVRKMKKRLARA